MVSTLLQSDTHIAARHSISSPDIGLLHTTTAELQLWCLLGLREHSYCFISILWLDSTVSELVTKESGRNEQALFWPLFSRLIEAAERTGSSAFCPLPLHTHSHPPPPQLYYISVSLLQFRVFQQ